jgi:hypothetical protein
MKECFIYPVFKNDQGKRYSGGLILKYHLLNLNATYLAEFLIKTFKILTCSDHLKYDKSNPAANAFGYFMEAKARFDDMRILCQHLLHPARFFDPVSDQQSDYP